MVIICVNVVDRSTSSPSEINKFILSSLPLIAHFVLQIVIKSQVHCIYTCSFTKHFVRKK
jgi:hypothetical protein